MVRVDGMVGRCATPPGWRWQEQGAPKWCIYVVPGEIVYETQDRYVSVPSDASGLLKKRCSCYPIVRPSD